MIHQLTTLRRWIAELTRPWRQSWRWYAGRFGGGSTISQGWLPPDVP